MKRIIFLCLLFNSITSITTLAQPGAGEGWNLGTIGYGLYTNTVNTDLNGTNEPGTLYYTFTLASYAQVQISNEGSTSYGLMDAMGSEYFNKITNTDGALTVIDLAPGIYHMWTNAWSGNSYQAVDITTTIKASIACANGLGSSITNAINIGILNAARNSFIDCQNSLDFNNAMGNQENDVFYKFTIENYELVTISNCGSAISDTYMRLLDSSGTEINSNDDNPLPECQGLQAQISMTLAPGTYYIVSEGSGGWLTTKTSIDLSPSGSSFSKPISAGNFAGCRGGNFTNTLNNSAYGFGNIIGEPSNDIYYRFTVITPGLVNINTNSSTCDTYLHLLDINTYGSYTEIASNDNDGPLAAGSNASIQIALNSGYYMAVTEGKGDLNGEITTHISMAENTSPPPAGASKANAIDAGLIAANTAFTHSLTPTDCYEFHSDYSSYINYKFSVTETSRIKIQSSHTYGYLRVFDAAGNEIYWPPNVPGTQTRRDSIQTILEPGTYWVAFVGYFGGETGIDIRFVPAPAGSTMVNPINVGELVAGQVYRDTINNSPTFQYGNEYGQPSDDVYHKFIVNTADEVNITHCGSSLNTVLHVLDSTGIWIATNDDNGVLCDGYQASLQLFLNPGTYYTVSEGFGTNSGEIKLNISLNTSGCATAEMDSTEFVQLPYFGNNDYLKNLMDSITSVHPNMDITMSGDGPSTSSFADPYRLTRIPLKFIFFHPSDPYGINPAGDTNDRQAQRLMDRLNELFLSNKTYFQFYLADNIQHVYDKDYLEVTNDEMAALEIKYRDPLALSILCVEGIKEKGVTLGFGKHVKRALFLDQSVYKDPIQGSSTPLRLEVLAHEMGHMFGLAHTFQYSDKKNRCKQEPVDRTRKYNILSICNNTKSNIICESTGDGLRDTPADDKSYGNSGCAYWDRDQMDLWKDKYGKPPAGSSRPDGTNLMTSHWETSCQTNFTYLQVAVMQSRLSWFISDLNTWTSPKYEFDTFEPDNSLLSARNINVSERQDRNFNYQPGADRNNLISNDVDWVRFVSPSTTSLTITTGIYLNSSPTSIILELYTASGVKLTSDDGSSKGKDVSQITYNFISGQTYFIKVINKNPAKNGYYTLQVGCYFSGIEILGNNNLCGSVGKFNIAPQFISPDVRVHWYIDGGMSISGAKTGSSVKINTNGNYTATLMAIITSPCIEGQPLILTRPITVSTSPCFWSLQNDDASSFSYSPNPANNELTVSYVEKVTDPSVRMKKVKRDFEAKILDSEGRITAKIKNLNEDNTVKINTRNLPEGIYYLHILDGKNLLKQQIIIKYED
ncbi:MAG: T9SS type A sorting domain-containing protein [Pyrinomonadaceae bacterium]|nr:T9SS type A sorting domain-containing protein [Sphingobacteriaceae bacterium]